MTISDPTKHWTGKARDLLLGRRIIRVEYMSAADADQMGWFARGIQLTLDGGLVVFVSQDDEGNGPGALFTSDEQVPVLPVLG